jgi:cell division protein FtsB
MNLWKKYWHYILAIIGIAALILLITDFNRRTADAQRLLNERNRIRVQVTALMQTKTALETLIAYTQSDDAVQKWAREEGRMIQPGDQGVVVLPPANSTPVPIPAVTVEVSVTSNWELWMRLLLRQSPSP